MLYTSGSLKKLGRVDHKDSFLDNHDLEMERGITIFSKQALLRYGNMDITLLDTPGHSDFSAEMERSLQVMDYTILVISGTDGVQAHTDTLWSLLKRYNIPTFLFITKMDVAAMSRDELMSDIREHLSEACLEPSDYENVALLDETVLEEFMSSETISDDSMKRLISERRLFPCFFGSGLKLEGIADFLSALDRLTSEIRYPDDFGARVFKISRDTKGKRLTYLKITGGRLNVKETVGDEKINEIRLYSGIKYEAQDSVEAGQVCAVLGLNSTYPGQGLGIEHDSFSPVLEPVLGYRIVLPKDTDPRAILPKLRVLEEEDPLLHVVWQEKLGEIQIQLMGAVQIDIIKALIKERFGTEIQIDSGHILYKETIAEPVEGVGHYEPLKHYSEVHLILEPLPRGSGLEFRTAVSTDVLDLNWQRLILTHLEEKQHAGVLTGSPVTDIRMTLTAGRAHLKHTEGGDFRQSTYRAVRQGLMKAMKAQKAVLLEPIYEFRLEVPSENIGRAITDVHNMGGEHSAPEPCGQDRMAISGTAPVEAMADYLTEVMAYTSGKGHFSCRNAGYRECSEAKTAAVLAEYAYDPEADLENTPDSVFCAHGAGFTVKWNQVEEYMHIESTLRSEPVRFGSEQPSAPASSQTSRPAYSIDDRELESIMEREFGPIRRRSYTAPAVNSAPERTVPLQKKERLIIDGYNLLFAWDEYKNLAMDNIDLAREKLINTMINYSSFRSVETVLVFDAYKVPGGKGERYDESGLHVAYTQENESADLYIERLADEIGKNENVRVVTSDSLIRLTALRSGIMRTSSKEFIPEVNEVLKQMREKLRTTDRH